MSVRVLQRSRSCRRCMTITLARLDPAGVDRAALIDFLTYDTFPHRAQPHPTVQEVGRRIDAGAYRHDDNDTFWIVHAEHERIGVFRFEDLEDGAPLFGLRLGSRFRGRGSAHRRSVPQPTTSSEPCRPSPGSKDRHRRTTSPCGGSSCRADGSRRRMTGKRGRSNRPPRGAAVSEHSVVCDRASIRRRARGGSLLRLARRVRCVSASADRHVRLSARGRPGRARTRDR